MVAFTWFKAAAAAVGAFITWLVGGWDGLVICLCVFMGLDYLTGVIGGIVHKNLSSEIGFKGILRKMVVLVILAVAVLVDSLIDQQILRDLVCYFYIANEGISILENAGKIGVPLPDKLMDVLKQLGGGKKDVE